MRHTYRTEDWHAAVYKQQDTESVRCFSSCCLPCCRQLWTHLRVKGANEQQAPVPLESGTACFQCLLHKIQCNKQRTHMVTAATAACSSTCASRRTVVGGIRQHKLPSCHCYHPASSGSTVCTGSLGLQAAGAWASERQHWLPSCAHASSTDSEHHASKLPGCVHAIIPMAAAYC